MSGLIICSSFEKKNLSKLTKEFFRLTTLTGLRRERSGVRTFFMLWWPLPLFPRPEVPPRPTLFRPPLPPNPVFEFTGLEAVFMLPGGGVPRLWWLLFWFPATNTKINKFWQVIIGFDGFWQDLKSRKRNSVQLYQTYRSDLFGLINKFYTIFLV